MKRNEKEKRENKNEKKKMNKTIQKTQQKNRSGSFQKLRKIGLGSFTKQGRNLLDGAAH